jgi:hypothetical protein
MRRTIAALACGVLLTGGCAPSGPHTPVEQQQLTGDEATNSAGARATAIAFVRAYGAADPAGLAAMTALAGSPVVRGWVHWQTVQYAEFPGSVDGSVDLRTASVAAPVAEVPGTSTLLREVALDAQVTFDYTPDDGDPFSGTRTIDAIRVARSETTPWVVVDLVRDGVPISTVYQPVGSVAPGEDTTVKLDSFVADPASGSWQFDLVVHTTLEGGLLLDPASAVLVDADGKEIAAATSVSRSLMAVIPGGPVEGLVRFDALDEATGVSLRLTFTGPSGDGAAEFPLEDQIEPVAGASPAATPAA